ncbi:MAG: VTT domain-containing protein [Candidatus Omnitrophota bacterium]
MEHIKKYKYEIGFLFLIFALALIWYLGKRSYIDTQAIQAALQKFPLFYGGIIYIVLYVTVTFFVFFSKDLFWLMGAVLFGPFLSALFISISEVINAFILFYLARYLGSPYARKRLSKKYNKLDDKLANISFLWLFIFRAAPLIPYRFLDLGAGLTRINFRRYLAAVIFGSPLKIFWIQYVLFSLGKSVFDPGALAGYFLSNKALFALSLVYIVLVIAVIFKIKAKD